MKKLVTILLALAMIVAMSTTAFAASTQLTVADGRTYTGHKLLNVTTSLKPEDTCEDGHTEDCYNYAYSVNGAYLNVLIDQAGVNTTDKTDLEIQQEIIDYLDGSKNNMRTVADQLHAKIVTAGIAGTTLTGEQPIDQGYWLFADVTDVDGEYKARSLVLVNTKGQDALEIKPKTGLPTVEKKVLDVNDTTGATQWMDSADHDINDTVTFQLTATLPENIANYNTYTIVFHDTLSAGLTLNTNSFTATANGTDVKDLFNYTAGQNGAFTYTCENVKAIDGVNEDTVIVITYTATLNENAVVGATGNTNEVYMEFSNDPYGTTTGETETDKVIVFTYKVVINKVDEEGNALNGAGFKLYKKNVDGEYVIIGTEQKGDAMTTFTWNGLDDGEYKLEESTVPAGYNKMADIEFTISAEHDEENANPALTSLNGGNLATGVVSTGIIEKNIENRAGSVLPETGAQGTMMLVAGGLLLIIVATVFMITRKKMSIYED